MCVCVCCLPPSLPAYIAVPVVLQGDEKHQIHLAELADVLAKEVAAKEALVKR